MDQIRLTPIKVGKDRVEITTTDGRILRGIVLTIKLPNEHMRFQHDDGEVSEMPLKWMQEIKPLPLKVQ